MVNAVNKYDHTPLMSACFRGYHTKSDKGNAEGPRLEIVTVLLANGADAKHMTKDTVMTATHWAAYRSDAAVVKMLLEHGAPHF